MNIMTEWEYKIEKTTRSMWSGKDNTNVEELLNNKGKECWELVSVVPDTTTGSLVGYHFFLKRKRI